VRASFKAGLIWVSAMMLSFMALCHIWPEAMVRPFASDPQVVAVGTEMLGILSFNFLAAGVVFVAGGVFQALGNTVPSLMASASRIVLFAIPAVILSRQPGFELHQLWWVSVASQLCQMGLSLWLLRGQMRLRAPLAPAEEISP
jgi:Na+-driven multidrug efflux pump